ncbi:hypothetical protein WV31_09865 [Magnetospirillum sp. ME-1]|uniref:hypothetical protein n=1 Tax=Magnetospirillum sp. ME-1 TaxID=1639348 RepID=UPI000A17F5B4|nr:hypothetical protein [Magnetospirillum sp. ME-1]ARJ65939.1 hypothetical protein WV31_09865 [Magnetospirillum sp. ME-1]
MALTVNYKPKMAPANDEVVPTVPPQVLTVKDALAKAIAFSGQTGTDQITAFLIEIVAANFNEIELEKVIGEIANATGLGKRALRNGLKQLKHQVLGSNPDPALVLARVVLEKVYHGVNLRVSDDGTFLHYTGTHWEETSPRLVRHHLLTELSANGYETLFGWNIAVLAE